MLYVGFSLSEGSEYWRIYVAVTALITLAVDFFIVRAVCKAAFHRKRELDGNPAAPNSGHRRLLLTIVAILASGAVAAGVFYLVYNRPVPPESDPAAEVAATIRALIPAAAGVRIERIDEHAEWGPTLEDIPIKERPLSTMWLLCKLTVADDSEMYKQRLKEFRFCSPASVIGPGKYVEEWKRSRHLGYYTIIQPDRITGFTCNVDGDVAQGTVSFEAPELWKGNVQYTARRLQGKWQITEFHLPTRHWRFVRSKQGTWTWFDFFGDVTDESRFPPAQPVSGKITFQEKPLAEIQIRFFHAQDPDLEVSVPVEMDGSYQARLPLGSYHVIVHRAPPNVPGKYSRLDDSGLKVEVARGDNAFDFELIP